MPIDKPAEPAKRLLKIRRIPKTIAGSADRSISPAKIINMHKLANTISDNRNIKPTDFWTMLRSFDETSTVRSKLVQTDVEKMPKDQWKPFLGYYIAACITGMARASGMLESLVRSKIISFGRTESRSPGAGARPPPGRHGPATCEPLPAPLRPILAEIPRFNPAFIQFIEARFWKTLSDRNLLPPAGRDDAGLKKRIALFHQQYSVGLLYAEIRVVLGQHLQTAGKNRDPALSHVIASKEAGFVFPWLMSMGVLEDVINRLLMGGAPDEVEGMAESEEGPDVAGPDDGINAGFLGPEQEHS